jgi:hypothetical protein
MALPRTNAPARGNGVNNSSYSRLRLAVFASPYQKGRNPYSRA